MDTRSGAQEQREGHRRDRGDEQPGPDERPEPGSRQDPAADGARDRPADHHRGNRGAGLGRRPPQDGLHVQRDVGDHGDHAGTDQRARGRSDGQDALAEQVERQDRFRRPALEPDEEKQGGGG